MRVGMSERKCGGESRDRFGKPNRARSSGFHRLVRQHGVRNVQRGSPNDNRLQQGQRRVLVVTIGSQL